LKKKALLDQERDQIEKELEALQKEGINTFQNIFFQFQINSKKTYSSSPNTGT